MISSNVNMTVGDLSALKKSLIFKELWGSREADTRSSLKKHITEDKYRYNPHIIMSFLHHIIFILVCN